MNKDLIAQRVARALKRTRLNQEQVAMVLEIPRTAVSAIENSKRDVTAYELYLICSLVNVSPDEILGWKTPKTEIPL